MNAFIRALLSIAKKLLKTELDSVAGRVNLLGGIIIAIFVAFMFTGTALLVVLDFVLALFGKTPIPAPSNLSLFLSVLGVIGYFIFCVLVIIKAQEARATDLNSDNAAAHALSPLVSDTTL